MDIGRLLAHLEAAIEATEKANSGLEPELVSHPDAKTCTALYAKLNRLSYFGVTALAGKLDDTAKLARLTGTSMGRAKDMAATSEVLSSSRPLDSALRKGEVSLDQATEIARAEEAAPGSAKELLKIAKNESFHVLRDEARRTKLAAEQHRGLADRQRKARRASHHTDELGMVNVHLAWEPHIGTSIMARAEAEAERLARAAKKAGAQENFEQYLADAYANLLEGSGKGRAKRPELVILVSHEVATRGWTDVKKGEVCKIPGVGPVSPEVAREIGKDAFLNGVLYDGKDLRHFKRWGRHIPVELTVALELGDGPDFDGPKCIDCGNRFKTQFDHFEPVAAGGPTSKTNVGPRCWPCHQAKTARDRLAGKLTPKRDRPTGRSSPKARTKRTRATKLQPQAP